MPVIISFCTITSLQEKKLTLIQVIIILLRNNIFVIYFMYSVHVLIIWHNIVGERIGKGTCAQSS